MSEKSAGVSRGRAAAAVIAAVAVGAVFAADAGAAAGKPGVPGRPSPVSVVTLTGSPVTLTAPETVHDLTLSPDSAVAFTQLPGEVVTVTMSASFDVPDADHLFCDLHAAVNLPTGSAAGSGGDYFAAVRQDWLAQRGDDWWRMTENGRDLTRTIPAPAVATEHTLVGVAWMGGPYPADGGPDPSADCFGIADGFSPQPVTASVRVSVVKLKSG